jgi:phage shock protein E
MKIVTMLSLVLLAFAGAYGQTRVEAVENVSDERFKLLMDSLGDEVLIDLRTPEELKQGKIPGAIVIDFFGPDFEPAIKGLDKKKTYLLYCAGGGRSGETAEIMEQLGFKKMYNLEGGFNGWVKKKMPVQK